MLNPELQPSDVDSDDDGPRRVVLPDFGRRAANRVAREQPGAVVCSKCNNVLPEGYTLKTCEVCRANGKRQVANGNKAACNKRRVESGAHAKYVREWKERTEGQASVQTTRENQKANGNKAANSKRQVENGNKAASNKRRVESGAAAEYKRNYRKTPAGQASRKKDRENQKANGNRAASAKRQVENGNKAAAAKRYYEKHKLVIALTNSLYKMLTGQHDFCASTTFTAYGIHVTETEWQKHFELQLKPWMTSANHAVYRKWMGYRVVWHIGHRIAKDWYDHSDPEEVRKCWSFANLFPQDGKENVDNGKEYFPPIADLMEMQPLWPKRWNGELPTPELKAALLAELKAEEDADLNASDAGSSDEGAYSEEEGSAEED